MNTWRMLNIKLIYLREMETELLSAYTNWPFERWKGWTDINSVTKIIVFVTNPVSARFRYITEQVHLVFLIKKMYCNTYFTWMKISVAWKSCFILYRERLRLRPKSSFNFCNTISHFISKRSAFIISQGLWWLSDPDTEKGSKHLMQSLTLTHNVLL